MKIDIKPVKAFEIMVGGERDLFVEDGTLGNVTRLKSAKEGYGLTVYLDRSPFRDVLGEILGKPVRVTVIDGSPQLLSGLVDVSGEAEQK